MNNKYLITILNNKLESSINRIENLVNIQFEKALSEVINTTDIKRMIAARVNNLVEKRIISSLNENWVDLNDSIEEAVMKLTNDYKEKLNEDGLPLLSISEAVNKEFLALCSSENDYIERAVGDHATELTNELIKQAFDKIIEKQTNTKAEDK
jgi:hypothetical protein